MMTDGGEHALDWAAGLRVIPVVGGKVVERQQLAGSLMRLKGQSQLPKVVPGAIFRAGVEVETQDLIPTVTHNPA
jgi:hypothetical protein